MKAGAFVINRRIDWLPDNREPGLIGWGISRCDVYVPHNGQWTDAFRVPQIKAHHCPQCEKFIFDGKLNP
jgi:hypothetical protein